jgi:hypothetical protein
MKPHQHLMFFRIRGELVALCVALKNNRSMAEDNQKSLAILEKIHTNDRTIADSGQAITEAEAQQMLIGALRECLGYLETP